MMTDQGGAMRTMVSGRAEAERGCRLWRHCGNWLRLDFHGKNQLGLLVCIGL